MFQLIVYGDRKDHEITESLLNLLQQYYHIHLFEDHALFSVGKGPPISLFDISELQECRVKNGVLIMKKNSRTNHLGDLSGLPQILISSENTRAIRAFAKRQIPIYTCGFGTKDDITFSSRSTGNTVVSLQREILLGKKVIEPGEIPCEIHRPLDDYTILTCSIIWMLLKETEEEGIFPDKIFFS